MSKQENVGSLYNDPYKGDDEFTPLSEILADISGPEEDHWQWYQSVPQLLGHEPPNQGPTQDWEFQLVDMQARGLLDKPAYKNLSDDIVATAQKAVAQGGDQAAGGAASSGAHARRNQINLDSHRRKLAGQMTDQQRAELDRQENHDLTPLPNGDIPTPHARPDPGTVERRAPNGVERLEDIKRQHDPNDRQPAPDAPRPHPKPAQTHVQRRRSKRDGLSAPPPSGTAQSGQANHYQTHQERKDARHGNNGPVARPTGKTLTPEGRKNARHGPNRDPFNNKRHVADEIIGEIVGVGADTLGATGMAMEKSGKKATQIRKDANRAKVIEMTAQRMANNPQSTGVKVTGHKAAQAIKEANRLVGSASSSAGESAVKSPQKAVSFFDKTAELANMPEVDLKKIVERGSRMAKAATILSIGYAAVKVATAEDKADEALKQGAPLAGSFLATAAVTALGLAAAPTLGGIAVAAGVLLAAGYAGSYVGDLVYEAISDKDDEPDYQPDQQV